MAVKPTIAIVGAGNLGSALAQSLRGVGYTIREIVSRKSRASRRKALELARKVGARTATIHAATLDADLIWLCVPDREIADVARSVAPLTSWKGRTALHSSGALSSNELNILRQRGAAVGSLHPLMTFVQNSRPSLAGVPFAAEGDAAALGLARRIVHDLKGEIVPISKKKKVAYHAWGAFTSPLLLAALVTAEEVAAEAGFGRATARRRMLPIVRQTIRNYETLGPAAAFSGPIIRGDAGTVARHLKALRKRPALLEVYLALSGAATRNLPVRNRRQLEKLLRAHRPSS